MVFFFIRSVSSTSTHTKLASGVTSSTNAGHIGITSPTKSYYGDEASTTPEVVNMQYFDTHGVSAGRLQNHTTVMKHLLLQRL
jgi:hypothetical protein